MTESDCLGNTKRTGCIFQQKCLEVSEGKCPQKWGQNLIMPPSQTKSARVKPKDSVTLERGHLSLFWCPTRGIETYLGRGAFGNVFMKTCFIEILSTTYQT